MPDDPEVTEDPAALADEVDEACELLAAESIISEERHEEILEGVEQCRASLATITSQLQATSAESPILNQLLAELGEVKANLQALHQQVQELARRPVSTSEPPSSPQPSLSPVPEESAAGGPPAPETPPEPPSPRRRKRQLI